MGGPPRPRADRPRRQPHHARGRARQGAARELLCSTTLTWSDTAALAQRPASVRRADGIRNTPRDPRPLGADRSERPLRRNQPEDANQCWTTSSSRCVTEKRVDARAAGILRGLRTCSPARDVTRSPTSTISPPWASWLRASETAVLGNAALYECRGRGMSRSRRSRRCAAAVAVAAGMGTRLLGWMEPNTGDRDLSARGAGRAVRPCPLPWWLAGIMEKRKEGEGAPERPGPPHSPPSAQLEARWRAMTGQADSRGMWTYSSDNVNKTKPQARPRPGHRPGLRLNSNSLVASIPSLFNIQYDASSFAEVGILRPK
jgi:hypothetical protein